jgi:CrcB protein
MSRFLLVCLGGAAGSGARYLVGLGAARLLGTAFPWGTLAVNVAGCFLISLAMDLGIHYGVIADDLRVFLTAGVLGGFTTYSSFNYELLTHLGRGHHASAALYLLLTVAGCFAAGVLGILAARLAA